jgi:protein-disulfide isomerase
MEELSSQASASDKQDQQKVLQNFLAKPITLNFSFRHLLWFFFGFLVLQFIFAVILIVGFVLAAPYLKINSGTTAVTTAESKPVAITDISFNNPPVLGAANAPLTLVEFADFQCPYCKAFFLKIFPQLKRDYIDTGKVRLLSQHMGFLGEESLQAAEAARCAQAQDAFWQFHDRLYELQDGENVGTFVPENLKKLAGGLGLEQASFDQCLDSQVTRPDILEVMQNARKLGIMYTPTLFIGNVKIEGVPDYKTIQAQIEAQLK